MRLRFSRTWIVYLPLALAAGCLYPVRQQVDNVICDFAARPLDVHTPATPEQSTSQGMSATTDSSCGSPTACQHSANSQPDTPEINSVQLANFQETQTSTNAQAPAGMQQPGPAGKGPLSFEQRLRLPSGLPERKAPQPLPPNASEAEKKAYRARYYPSLPPLPPLPKPEPGPFGHPLTLSELQQLAMANSPLLRQATSDVEAAEGAAKQAGAYPNPSFGYDSSNVNTAGTAGYQGIFIEQMIKTAGKLKTAQASALMSLLNAQIALRRAQTDLMTQVRSNYFALLVAEKNLRLNEALAEFTERLYTVFVDQ